MTGSGTAPGRAAGGPARHVPVLIEEAIAFLAPVAGGIYVDGTYGAGGYTAAILAAGASVLAIDRDPAAIAAAAPDPHLTLVEGRFSELDEIARARLTAPVDGVVLDVGVSSMQLDEAERGFSFRGNGPLDMRMEGAGHTAADVVNAMPVADLARILKVLGEEKKAKIVAGAIARARTNAPIETTGQLAEIVAGAIGRGGADRIHPATRTFQALRIYVNRELDELAAGLVAAERLIAEGGRLVVVSFHSLEDRIVKRFLAERSAVRAGGSRHRPEAELAPPTFELITRSAVAPSDAEVTRNPRARSARLRAARRTAAPARPLDAAAVGVPAVPAFMPGRAP